MVLLLTCLAVGTLCAAAPEQGKTIEKKGAVIGATTGVIRASDGVIYATEDGARAMQMAPLGGNLLENGSFERGRYWPAGWQATDGLTTFWAPGGTHGKRCLRIFTDVLDSQWKSHWDEVRRAVALGERQAGGDAQALPQDPRPPVPERIPTSPPYYDTVAGLHGVHYRSQFVPIEPRAIYRFSIDARTDTAGKPHEPRVFIKGFFDQKMKTARGVQIVRRNAYRAPMILDPCDETWRRYARTFHPWRSKSTLAEKPLKPEYLQVQIYAYWRPGSYYFDNVRLEIVGMEEEEKQPGPAPQKDAEPAQPKEPLPTSDGYPVIGD
ncbi:MAG: hypothetical protein J7M08_01390 [Planctomycetes bacterium]|nr:hypothetical protein [Planctomycetota bacterium]